jgi:hypothetical protein
MNCSTLLQTPAQQTKFRKNWKKYRKKGLETYTQFKKEYRRGFILGCQMRATQKRLFRQYKL